MDIHTIITQRMKANDADRYRALGFAAPERRNRLLVLYGLHLELAKVPELVSEPMLGEIRYQWWRDSLEAVYEGNPLRPHEIATPLAKLITDQSLSRFHLERLIDGRARDLDPTPFADIAAAQNYARETSGRLMLLAGEALEQPEQDALLLAGEAWGLTGLARAWRFYSGNMLAGLSFADICDAASTAYKKAQQTLNPVVPELLPAVAYIALIPGYLKAMSRGGFDPLKDPVHYGTLSKQIALLRASLTGRI